MLFRSLLVFLRSRGLVPNATTLQLAKRAFQPSANLPGLLQSLINEESDLTQSLVERLAELLPKPPQDNLAATLARQLTDLGWFYEGKLRRALNNKEVDFNGDVKHLIGQLASQVKSGKSGKIISELWEILTASSLKNLPAKNIPVGEIYFPILFNDDELIKQAHLRVVFSPEGECDEKRKQASNFCFAFYLDMSVLGPLLVIADVRKQKEVYLDFQVATDTIKKLLDNQAIQLKSALKAHGFMVKRWRTMVKTTTFEQFFSGTLSSRIQRWGRVDFLV